MVLLLTFFPLKPNDEARGVSRFPNILFDVDGKEKVQSSILTESDESAENVVKRKTNLLL